MKQLLITQSHFNSKSIKQVEQYYYLKSLVKLKLLFHEHKSIEYLITIVTSKKIQNTEIYQRSSS